MSGENEGPAPAVERKPPAASFAGLLCLNLVAAYAPALFWVPGLPGSGNAEMFVFSPVAFGFFVCMDVPIVGWFLLPAFLLLVVMWSWRCARSSGAWVLMPCGLFLYSLVQGLAFAWLIQGIHAIGRS